MLSQRWLRDLAQMAMARPAKQLRRRDAQLVLLTISVLATSVWSALAQDARTERTMEAAAVVLGFWTQTSDFKVSVENESNAWTELNGQRLASVTRAKSNACWFFVKTTSGYTEGHIDFTKVSSEYRLRRRVSSLVSVEIFGTPRGNAFCRKEGDEGFCHDNGQFGLGEDEYPRLLRAVAYLQANGCPAAQLPF